uniref:ATP synthase complex subunit 8 n=1 Tax=Gerres oyena TaxID=463597 RepID=A0A0B6VP76_9TELE|nr:ATPase subunit 8 [Gerres oyena]BAQ20855.1 ATPase subunit 8 [Gerres oyena]
MPQLNPTPWLAIFMFSWFVFLATIPSKMMAHDFPNDPTLQAALSPITEPWSWPWF